jgi:hypothetical protein
VAALIRSTEKKTMKKATGITGVFLEIGGVLLAARCNRAARHGEYTAAMERM